MERAKAGDINTIIFDLDGTLHQLDINWGKVRERLGIANADVKIGDVIQRLRLEHDPQLEVVTQAELAAVGDQALAREIIGTLQALHHAGHNLAVLTRNSRRAVTTLLQNTGGHDLHNAIFIVGREDVEQLKPHPGGVQLILDHFGVQADQAALVGDTFHDVKSAHAAGTMSIVIDNPALAYEPEGADAYIAAVPDVLELLGVEHDKSLLWP